jgi:cytochrome c peroxidase
METPPPVNRINKAKMTREELRAYNAAAKARSRLRKRAQGLCIVCGVVETKDGLVSCTDCHNKATAYERSSNNGKYPGKRKRAVSTAANGLRRSGQRVTIKAIVEMLDESYDFVRDTLRAQGHIS